MTPQSTNPLHTNPLHELLQHRIAIIDGAMGTTIRTYGMKEADIRGERFKDAKKATTRAEVETSARSLDSMWSVA